MVMGIFMNLTKEKRKKKKTNIFSETSRAAKRMDKKRITIFWDMIKCAIKYKANPNDYYTFKMYEMTKYERLTIITKGINNEYCTKYNNPKYTHFFHNKSEFNKVFDNYLNRDWLELNGKNKIAFAEFCKKHPVIIAKPSISQNGNKIEKFDTTEWKLKDLYEELVENKQTLIEEVIEQCDKLNKLHLESINTIRVVTLLGKIVACYLKIGNNHKIVDNYSEEGLIVPIDIHTGSIIYPAVNKYGTTYEHHPITKKQIVGLQIPRFQEVIELCENACVEIPEVGYVGWDIVVGSRNCSLLDATEFPEHEIYGLPAHREGNVGLLPVFKQAEERELEQ